MTNTELETLVENERSELLEESDTIEEAVVMRTGRGDTVAQGLLVLDRPTEAIEWFGALSDEWSLRGEEIWETKYEKNERETAQERPFRQYHMSILTGLLGNVDLEDTARTSYDRVTEPFVDELLGREREHRIDTIGLLAGFLLEEVEYDGFIQSLREHVEENDTAYGRARYPPYAEVIEGLAAGDVDTVTAGVTDLLDFHEEFVIGARDTDAVDEAFALDAAAMLVLARRNGMVIDVESEYLPGALTDDEYYPVKG